jgi:hypothetical protein
VFINASGNRKESFFKIQRLKLEKKRSAAKILLLSIKKQKKIRRARSLKLFQDVTTRWDSTCHMLVRAHDLRSKMNQFYFEWSVTYLRLNNDEWSQIEYLIDLLKSFCLFTKTLSTTRTSTIHTIFKVYNRLFEHLEKARVRLTRKRVLWKKSLLVALKITEAKLIKYYSLTQDGLGLLYDKTILLHLTVGDELFQSAEWKVKVGEIPWHKIYWDVLKETYHEYKQQTSQLNIDSQQS